MHFPGFHIEATQALLETKAVGMAVDTLSLDHGPSGDFATHYAWLPAGRYGIFDLVGNAEEWVADWWQGSLGNDPQTDPTGPATGTHRVTKGGGWDFDARLCRSAIRGASEPNYSGYYIGFRLARSE